MFYIGLIKRMKSLMKDATCIFWTFLFPVMLAFAFCIGIPSSKYQEFHTIPVAIVENGWDNMPLYVAMEQEKTSTGNKIFNVSLCTEVMAEERLENGEIDAYIVKKKIYHVISAIESPSVSLLKIYLENHALTEGKQKLDFQSSYMMPQYAEKDFNRNEVYFLSLIAMTSFCAMFWGLRIINDLEASQSRVAMRMMVSPVSMRVIVCQNILNLAFIEFVINVVMLLVGIYMNHMDFSGKIPRVLAIQMATSAVGVLLGVLLGTVTKEQYEVKQKWCQIITFVSSFLGGVMMYRVRYSIDTAIPLLGKLNPVNIAADALFHIYFVESSYDYAMDLAILLFMIVTMGAIQFHMARRKMYGHM